MPDRAEPARAAGEPGNGEGRRPAATGSDRSGLGMVQCQRVGVTNACSRARSTVWLVAWALRLLPGLASH